MILHNIFVIYTLPPEAQSEPSGDTVTVLRYPVCPQ